MSEETPIGKRAFIYFKITIFDNFIWFIITSSFVLTLSKHNTN